MLNRMRLSLSLATAAVALSMIVTSCRDTLSSDAKLGRPDDARVTRAVGIPSAAVQALARLHAKNPHDWVGKAHNKALEDLRKEIQKPGILTRDLCTYVVSFIGDPARLPTDKRSDAARRGTDAAAGLATTEMCKNRGNVRDVAFAPSPLWLGQDAPASAAAYQMLSDVQSALDNASDAYDFAVRLEPVFLAASSLETGERAMLEATISVAQYSYDYWQIEYPALEQAFRDEYFNCARLYLDYSVDMSREICLEGGVQPATEPQSGRSRVPAVRFAALAPQSPEECRLTPHFKRMAGADVMGAFVGAMRHAFTLHPVGIGAGAFQGGATASFGSFLASTWVLWRCSMR